MAVARSDDLDRRLLHALQVDGRAPFRRIAEVLGVSDQTVARRYARLRSTGALRVVGLVAAAADGRPGQGQWLVRGRATPEAAGEVAEALARRGDTSWISLCSGGTEIVSAVDGAGVDSLLLDALPRTRQVLDVGAQQVLHTFYGGAGRPFTKHGPLSPSDVARLAEHLPAPAAPVSLDDTDHRLLEVLRLDGRASVEELMSATRSSASTVRRRLNDLRARGVLHLDVDVDLGLLELAVRTIIWLRVRPGDLERVGQALASHAEVAFAAATTGPANATANLVTRDAAHVYRYLTTAVAVLPGVDAVETSPVLRNVKAAETRYGVRRPPRGAVG